VIVNMIRPIIRFLPRNIAYALTRYLASLPQKPKLNDLDMAILTSARQIKFGPGNNKTAWSWGKGPIVIVVHGWGSCGAKMGELALRIAGNGFEAIAIDITGHGYTPGKRISFKQFCRDIGELASYLEQEIYACIGHSAGGLCMMEARNPQQLEAKKYICISSPQKPYPALNMIRKKLQVPDSVIKHYQKYLASQFNCCWEEITQRVYWGDPNSQLLLLYDTSDSVVSHSDGDEIKACWSSSKLVKTQGISHSRQIHSTEIQNVVIDFLVDDKIQG